MNDPWKFLAFPVASVVGYLVALGVFQPLSAATGLTPMASKLFAVAFVGLLAGFLVDEVIPVYVKNVRSKGGSGGGDFDGDLDDMDFE